VSILVPLLTVLGLFLLAWGAFRMMWDAWWDRVSGGIVLIASVASLSAGALGLIGSIR